MLDPVYDKSARIYDLLYTGIGIKDYAAEAEQLRRVITGACPAAHTLIVVAALALGVGALRFTRRDIGV